jgi:hypothetical protein
MALIWVEGFIGNKALAPLWRRYMLAEARWKDTSLSPLERGEAIFEAEAAKAAYDSTVAEAETTLAQAATSGKAYTHALVVGVGRYEDALISALTTSVHGMWAFADWMLTRFQHPNRPLGSLELLLSPSVGLGDWRPPTMAATKLGLTSGETLPVEAATFANIKDAFERWLKRAGTLQENAAFFYFSGHGLWKLEPFLLPEDARIATGMQFLENLIDVQQTQINMFNTPPSVQCFFLDVCQEIPPRLLHNLDAKPGKALRGSVNAPAIPDRDAQRYVGSYTGRKAYGPEDKAPFFTQELLACLERRGAEGAVIDDNTWSVTTSSLRRALEAASCWRQEVDTKAKDIKFSCSGPGGSTFTAELCQIQGCPEVFVSVLCLPTDMMSQARLYVESGGARYPRFAPLPAEWYITVAQGDCLAGVEFDAAAWINTTQNFVALPPRHPIRLRIKRQAAGESGL